MGAAIGHYQRVYAEFPVLAVNTHAEAFRQEGLHHGGDLPTPAAFRQFGLNIVAFGDHPVGAGDLVTLYLVGQGDQVVERELADADVERIDGNADVQTAGLHQGGRNRFGWFYAGDLEGRGLGEGRRRRARGWPGSA